MGTFRKTAREAVIFILLGPIVVAVAAFVLFERESIERAKTEAAQAVYASDVKSLGGFKPDNSVLVPLTNGVQLYVTDCSQAHPDPAAKLGPPARISGEIPVPPGASNGADCVYFTDDAYKAYGGHLTAVPVGDKDQVAIEAQYWQAYGKTKAQARIESTLGAGLLSLWGFLGGFIVWLFYRMVRFAIKG